MKRLDYKFKRAKVHDFNRNKQEIKLRRQEFVLEMAPLIKHFSSFIYIDEISFNTREFSAYGF